MNHETLYKIIGYTSSFLFILTIYGIYDQIIKIRQKIQTAIQPGEATQNLSINQFLCHFLGVYAFFIYGFLIEEFNPYLVWPRLIASFAVLLVLYLILIDRKNPTAFLTFFICTSLLVVGLYKLIFPNSSHSSAGIASAKIIIIFVTLINIQGYVHQIIKLHKSKNSSALSLKMNILIFAKDLSSFILGAMMGYASGWPVMMQSFSNGFFRSYISTLIVNYSKKPLAKAG